MRRKRSIGKHSRKEDSVFHSLIVAQLINYLMIDGEKRKAKKIVYSALKLVKEKTQVEPMVALQEALENVKPKLETVSVRVGGTIQRIPREVNPERSLTLASRWIVKAARGIVGQAMFKCLAQEIIDARQKQGEAFKTKKDKENQAIANFAFVNYRSRFQTTKNEKTT